MKTIETTIFVEPTPKGRPRFAIVNGHARAFTPAKTRNAEAEIVIAIRNEVLKHGRFMDDTPLRLDAVFYIPKPKSKPKRVTMPTTKPDIDNYGKLCLDALSGYLFKNDSQITTLVLRKRYCEEGKLPRVELKVREDIE